MDIKKRINDYANCNLNILQAVALFLILFVVPKISCFGQKYYTFGQQGGECYFDYIIYNPTEDLKLIQSQPIIFILGQPGETALKTYELDTLRLMQKFYYYKFVYIPNKGGTPEQKTFCFEPLVNLMHVSQISRTANIFLYVYDIRISRLDLETYGIAKTFDDVQIALETSPADETFLINKFNITIKEEETELGTFYYEEAKKSDSLFLPKKAVAEKTYFGPPTAFNFSFSGIIRDKSTGEALPFASIIIKGTNIGTQTNVDGFFTLLNVPNDTTTLVISYIGYDKTQLFLTPATNKQNFIIQLSPSSNVMNAVTITAAKEDVVLSNKEDVSVIKMTPKKLEQLPSLGERDIMRSFQLMPGVSASNESSSGLYVRGGTPDQNLVLYDGFTVYQVDHLYGFYSAFNSNALKDVQLYKGGFESKFGGRLSSVTEITGKDGNQKGFNIGGDLSLLSINLWSEIPIGEKFSSIITFRKSYKGPLYNTLFDAFNTSSEPEVNTNSSNAPAGGPGGFSQNVKVTSYFYDLNGKFTYRANDKDIISLSVFNGTDKLDNSIGSSDLASFGGVTPSFSFNATDLTKYGNFGTSLKWSRKWNEKLYSNTVVSYSNYFSNRNRSQQISNSSSETTVNNGIFENNDLSDYSIKSDYQYDLLSFIKLQYGGFITKYDIKYSYAQNDTSSVLDKNDNALLAGIYLQGRMNYLHGKLQLLPGIRVSYFEETSKPYFEPRLSISYSVNEKLTIKGAFGKYYQFANRVTREDLLSGSKDFWLLSDGESIPVSSAVHNILGLSYETNRWLFSAEGYYKKLTGLTEYSLRFNPSPQGVSYDENFFTGYGYAKGIEFLLQRKLGKINGWMSYTIGEAQSHFDAYSTDYFPANQDVTHEFKIVSLYNYRRWNFSATWVYATGRPYTAPSGAYSITLLDGTTSDYFTVTSKNSLRLPDYHRMDVSANYKLLWGSRTDQKRRELGYVGISLFNVYDRTNIWYKQYTIEDNQIITTNVNYLGITPNLTLSLKLW